ncbi:MAG: hypothetical protein Q8L24_01130 [bacterium]|nr:hypothetical protein [bacterium]
MAWYWWVAVAVFVYFSVGFAYFPILDQCIDRTRAQWLIKFLLYFFWPATVLTIVVPGIAEAVMANIERNPGTVRCQRLQKFLFWTAFGPSLLWIAAAVWVGRRALKILRVPERCDGSPDRHDA